MKRVNEKCVACLYDKQENSMESVKDKVKAQAYLEDVKSILDNRNDNDCAPYLVACFKEKYKEYFGEAASNFSEKKRKYNDLVMNMLPDLADKINEAEDPVKMALFMARIGNYIDFGAMNHVDDEEFMNLFANMEISDQDEKYYELFSKECEEARSFLLLADNCGEIVLDVLFLEQMAMRYKDLALYVLVRGEEVLNDVTMADAMYVGVQNVAMVLENGNAVAGTVYDLCSEEAKMLIDNVDIILAKGQGNYESFSGYGKHTYYSFLCKCDLFTERFNVPRLSGMFISEK